MAYVKFIEKLYKSLNSFNKLANYVRPYSPRILNLKSNDKKLSFVSYLKFISKAETPVSTMLLLLLIY